MWKTLSMLGIMFLSVLGQLSILLNPKATQAATLRESDLNFTGIQATLASNVHYELTGNAYGNFTKRWIDGQVVFCLDPYTGTLTGSGYREETPTAGNPVYVTGLEAATGGYTLTKDLLLTFGKVGSAGYHNPSSAVRRLVPNDDHRYAYTQLYLWEKIDSDSNAISRNRHVNKLTPSLSEATYRQFKQQVESDIRNLGSSGGSGSSRVERAPWDGKTFILDADEKNKSITLPSWYHNSKLRVESSGGLNISTGYTISATLPRGAQPNRNYTATLSATETTAGGVQDYSLVYLKTGSQALGKLDVRVSDGGSTTYRGSFTVRYNEEETTDFSLGTKVSSTTGRSLQGARFRVTLPDGLGTKTITSNFLGEIILADVKPSEIAGKTIYVEELTAPAGHVVSSERVALRVNSRGTGISSGNTQFKNDPAEGKIRVNKSSTDGSSVSGITFKVYDSSNTLVETLRTSYGGTATSKSLPLGRYKVVEDVPSGYRDPGPKYVTISSSDVGSVVSISFVNEPMSGNVKIVKRDSETGAVVPVAGAVFEIFDSFGNSQGQVTTDRNGEARKTGLQFGSYTVKEVTAPSGYTITEKSESFTISANNLNATVSVSNDPQKGRLKLVKRGETVVSWSQNEDGVYTPEYSEAPLGGVTFDLIDDAGETVETLRTDDNGEVTSNLHPLGNYTLVEKSAPEDYVVKQDPISVSFTPQNQTVEVHDVSESVLNNLKYSQVKVTKNFEGDTRGRQEGTYERDAVIGLYTNQEFPGLLKDSLIGKVEVTGGSESQTLTFDKVPIAGSFYVKEISSGTGYDIDEAKYEVATKFDGNVPVVEGDTIPTVENKLYPVGELKLQKVDRVHADKNLSGAEFKLYRLTDNGEEEYGEYTTDGEGKFHVIGLPLGRYKLVETAAPEGYFLDAYAHEFELVSDGQIEEQTVSNQPIPSIGTKANINGQDKLEDPLSSVDIHDLVEYKDLEVGKEYRLTGELMYAGTNESVKDASGNPIVATKLFTPDTASGSETLIFENVDAKLLRGKEVVVFETLFLEGRGDVADHKDPNDKDQTVEFTDPKIGTTATYADGSKLEDPLREIIIYDNVKYENLVPGKEYTLTGWLMDKETEQPFKGSNGETYKVTKTFRPSKKSGVERMDFTIDARGLAGKSLVVYEELKRGVEIVAKHKDINDAGQTVEFTKSEIGTTAVFDNMDKEFNPIGKAVIYDDVHYKGLVPGKEYTVKGYLMRKSTNSPLEQEGRKIEAQKTFTPTEPNGTVRLEFIIDASKLRGEEVVAFEHLYRGEDELAAHAEIDDDGQTVRVVNPALHTTAIFGDGGKLYHPNTEVEIHDTVTYKDLTVGQEYVMRGWLMDKESGSELLVDGEKVTSEVTFTPDAKDGTVNMLFKLNASDLRGKELVVYEELYYQGELVGDHKDIDDEGQTVRVVNPKIKTLAKFNAAGAKVWDPLERVEIVDTVSYEDLIPGKTYRLDGTLHDQNGELVLDDSGEVYKASGTFTPENPTGTTDITFVVSGVHLRGKKVVVYEKLIDEKDEEIANHEDPEDEGQTVEFKDPKIGTTATFTDGLKENDPLEMVEVHDDVKYENLIPGHEYVMRGYLMKKGTEEPLLNNGEKIEVEKRFTPEESQGVIRLTFKIPASLLRGEELVAFEHLSRSGEEIAVHTDINDEGQTVRVTDQSLKTQAYFEDLSQVANPVKEVEIFDKVSYTDLVPSHEYVLKGRLMDKGTGEVLTDPSGDPYTVEKTFTPSEKSGEVEVSITVDASVLKGKELVYFEELYREGELVAKHTDLEDVSQTVRIIEPNLGTTATFEEEPEKLHEPQKQVEIHDDVEYKDLIVGKEYTLTGTMRKKSDGEPLLNAEGEPYTVTKTFIPTETSGVERLTFLIDARDLRGEKIVAFESLSYQGEEVGSHTDIDDEDQTVGFTDPKVGTTALWQDHNKLHNPLEKVVLHDDVHYEGLIEGREYTVTGTVMVKETGEVLTEGDKPVVKTETFVADKGGRGVVRVSFEMNLKDLRGQTLVVYERLYRDGEELARHEDLEDKGQTVRVTNPILGTLAYINEDEKVYHGLKEVTIHDKVEFKDLVPHKEYVMTGLLMDKVTGKPILDADGKPYEVSRKFTPTENGEVKPDETTVEPNETTVEPDETTVEPDETTVEPDETTVEPDETTTVEPDETTVEPDETTVEPDKPTVDLEGAVSGSIILDFVVAAEELVGKEVVVFETLYHEGEEVGYHRDINDEGQTVKFMHPKIGTTATYDGEELKEEDPLSKVQVVDKIAYEGLIPGKSYTVTGHLVSKETGEMIAGTQQAVEFVPEASEGIVEMTFELNQKDLRGKEIVAFEKVSYEGEVIAIHEDLNDPGQTVKVTNPEIGTTAVFDGGKKLFNPLNKVTIHDDVKYKDLVVGKEYRMKGWLMDKESGQPLAGVKSEEVTFVPESKDGVVRVSFTFSAKELEGKTLVAFEQLYRGNELIAAHEDIDDEDQTVKLTKIKIGTKATFKGGSKEADPTGEVTVVDKVSYEGLVSGETYVMRGKLMDKASGDVLKHADGTEVEAEATFKAEKADGEVALRFTFNAKDLAGKEVVAFERLLTPEGELLAKHEDIQDQAQTVKFRTPKPEEKEPEKKKPKKVIKAPKKVAKKVLKAVGDWIEPSLWIIFIGIGLVGIAGYAVLRKR